MEGGDEGVCEEEGRGLQLVIGIESVQQSGNQLIYLGRIEEFALPKQYITDLLSLKHHSILLTSDKMYSAGFDDGLSEHPLPWKAYVSPLYQMSDIIPHLGYSSAYLVATGRGKRSRFVTVSLKIKDGKDGVEVERLAEFDKNVVPVAALPDGSIIWSKVEKGEIVLMKSGPDGETVQIGSFKPKNGSGLGSALAETKPFHFICRCCGKLVFYLSRLRILIAVDARRPSLEVVDVREKIASLWTGFSVQRELIVAWDSAHTCIIPCSLTLKRRIYYEDIVDRRVVCLDMDASELRVCSSRGTILALSLSYPSKPRIFERTGNRWTEAAVFGYDRLPKVRCDKCSISPFLISIVENDWPNAEKIMLIERKDAPALIEKLD